MPDWKFKLTPWAHQMAAMEYVFDRKAAMLQMGMGTGKSAVVVNLVVNRGHKATLVVCPLAVLNVWSREFERHAATPVHVLVLDKGSTLDKQKKADAFLQRYSPAVIVINYESAWREPFGPWACRRCPPWDLVVLDESHRCKDATGRAGKWIDKLRINTFQRLCLSGTPMAQTPLDIFSQYRFLNPQVFGRWVTHFRAKYAVMNPVIPGKVDKWINQEELEQKVKSLAFQVSADVLDLPPAMHKEVTVELSAPAVKIYRSMEQDLIAEFEGGVMSAANAMVKLLRLQQLTGGSVKTDEGQLLEVDKSKQSALADFLEDLPTAEPVVVFCRFRHDLTAVQNVAAATGRRYGELSGERRDLSDQAMMRDDVDLMAVQIQSGGVGVDLTRACYCVYYSLGFSLSDYLQSTARLHRPGQNRAVRYYHLVARGTVDHRVYEALRQRKEVVDYVLGSMTSHEQIPVTSK